MSRSSDWDQLFSYAKSDIVGLDAWIKAEEKRAFIEIDILKTLKLPSGDNSLDATSYALPWVDAYEETK